jgi:hypothetical protein
MAIVSDDVNNTYSRSHVRHPSPASSWGWQHQTLLRSSCLTAVFNSIFKAINAATADGGENNRGVWFIVFIVVFIRIGVYDTGVPWEFVFMKEF